jgi:hypothetical protein
MLVTSFVEWLRAQAKSDPDREQVFSDLYVHGPYFVHALGENPPDPVAFKAHLALSEDPAAVPVDELLRQLVIADATWRTDTMTAEDDDDDDEPTPEPGTSLTASPLKSATCGFRDLDGTTCRSAAVDGAARCNAHGGGITDPGIRGSLLLLAYAQLVHGTKTAVSTLIDVMETSSNDLARVNAAKEMLDRAGLGVDTGTVHITAATESATDSREAQLERIRKHLDTTKARLLPPAPSDDDIVDAELVDDDVPESA